jgi:hypothetical protein
MEIRIAKGVCGRHRTPRERYPLRSGGARPCGPRFLLAGDYLEIYRELAAVRATSTQVRRLNGKEVPLPTAASLAVATKAFRPVLAHPSKRDPRMARGNVTARPVTPMKHDRSAMPG